MSNPRCSVANVNMNMTLLCCLCCLLGIHSSENSAHRSEAYSEPCQLSKMELLAKIVSSCLSEFTGFWIRHCFDLLFFFKTLSIIPCIVSSDILMFRSIELILFFYKNCCHWLGEQMLARTLMTNGLLSTYYLKYQKDFSIASFSE